LEKAPLTTPIDKFFHKHVYGIGKNEEVLTPTQRDFITYCGEFENKSIHFLRAMMFVNDLKEELAMDTHGSHFSTTKLQEALEAETTTFKERASKVSGKEASSEVEEETKRRVRQEVSEAVDRALAAVRTEISNGYENYLKKKLGGETSTLKEMTDCLSGEPINLLDLPKYNRVISTVEYYAKKALGDDAASYLLSYWGGEAYAEHAKALGLTDTEVGKLYTLIKNKDYTFNESNVCEKEGKIIDEFFRTVQYYESVIKSRTPDCYVCKSQLSQLIPSLEAIRLTSLLIVVGEYSEFFSMSRVKTAVVDIVMKNHRKQEHDMLKTLLLTDTFNTVTQAMASHYGGGGSNDWDLYETLYPEVKPFLNIAKSLDGAIRSQKM